MTTLDKVTVKFGTIPQFKVIREASLKYQTGTETLSGPDAVASVCQQVIGDLDREHAMVLYLNNKHKVLGYEVVSIGTADSCLMTPKEVFRGALIHGAVAIALAHNHPSGDPTPSAPDLAVTDVLIKAGKLIGIEVLDHVVIGDNCYKSIREQSPMLWMN